MNTLARIAAITLAATAATAAMAESPDAAGPQVIAAQPAAIKVPTAVVAGTVVTEADLQRQPVVASTRSRADVRAEVLAALASGELPRVAGDADPHAGATALARTRGNGRLSALAR
jgi:hypothetical protein